MELAAIFALIPPLGQINLTVTFFINKKKSLFSVYKNRQQKQKKKNN